MNNVNTEGCALIETDKDHLTLTTDDGRDLLCSIVGIFRTPEQSYIVLIPEEKDLPIGLGIILTDEKD